MKVGLETIDKNARAQAKLIEDLLDMSRIISGKVKLDLHPLDISEVTKAALETLSPAVNAKGLELRTSIDSSAGFVVGDANRIQQILWNLLSNAVRYTQTGGWIEVKLARADDCVRISISDSGEGIDPSFLPYVFDRFRQADASTTRRHGGLGLGLSIVKHLTELHGGSVEALSAGKGAGSTFSVILPSRPPAIMGGVSADKIAAGKDTLDNESRLDGIHVLAVDDEEDARTLVRAVLEEKGARVSTAASARAALEVIENARPDIILSDVAMPEEDGYELMKQV
jgi:CheY-like chemotaxis protein